MKDDMVNKRLNKRDIEGFLSSFVYNAYGSTNINQIANMVFSDENIGNKLNNRVRGNPPPEDA